MRLGARAIGFVVDLSGLLGIGHDGLSTLYCMVPHNHTTDKENRSRQREERENTRGRMHDWRQHGPKKATVPGMR